jgi:DNA-binding MarR family transcriptional regulator
LKAFDPLLLSQARLGIVGILLTRPEAAFSDLKQLLDLTQGNLGVHLTKLEDAGYVSVKKSFVDKKPRTSCKLTAKGRRAFVRHVEQLRELTDGEQS